MSGLTAGTVSLGVKPDTTGFGTTLKGELLGHTKGIGEGMGGVLMGGLKAMAGPIAAVTAAFSVGHLLEDSMHQFEDLASGVRTLGRVTGGSTEDVSGLRAAMQLSGVEADKAQGAMTIFAKNLGKVGDDSKKTAAMTALLGENFKDTHGNVKPLTELLPGLADKFQSMPAGAEKTALAMQLFGRSGAQMLPFLNKGSEGIGELTQKAKDMGLVLDDTSMNIFVEAKKSAREFNAAIQGTKVALGQDLIPVVDAVQNVFRNALTPVLSNIAKFLGEHREGFVKLGEAIGEFGKKGMSELAALMQPVLDAFKALAPTFAALLPQVMTLMTALSPMHIVFESLKPLLPALIGIVVQLAQVLGGTLGNVLKEILPPITDVVKTLTTALAGVMVQLMPAITQLAQIFSGVLATVIRMVAPLIVELVKAVASLLPPLLPLIPQIITLVISAIMPLAKAILPLIQELLPPFIDLIKALLPPVLQLAKFLEGVLVVAIQIVIDVMKAIIPIITNVIKWFANLVVGIATTAAKVTTFFVELPGKILAMVKSAGTWLLEAGKNVVDGLINGLRNGMAALGSAVKSIGDSVIGGFKNLLGIHSPSTVFNEFGKNIIEGLNQGLVGGSSDVVGTMQKVSDWFISAFDSGKITDSQRAAGLAAVQAFGEPLKGYETDYKAMLNDLDAQTKDLQNRITERANFVTSLASKFDSTLAIDDKTTAATAIQNLQDKIAKTDELKAVTGQLLDMGLNQSLYKQIVEAGSVDFAKSIIAGGQQAVNQLNVLGDQADKKALELANSVGDTLYGQGIKFSQAIVDGLNDQKSALETLMAGVADQFQSRISQIVQGYEGTVNAQRNQMDSAIFRMQQAQAGTATVADTNKIAAVVSTSSSTTADRFSSSTVAAQTAAAGNGTTIIYNAAPNDSISAEQKLVDAVQKAKVLGWT